MKTFNFSTETTSLGRNGYMKTVGVEVHHCEKVVTFCPINTQGVGRCCIEIPVADLPAVIAHLQTIAEG